MKRIAHYRILEKIGEGAMGSVFLAEDTRLDRRVALKVLLKETPDGSRGKRFEREAKAIAALSHPNILSIFDYGRDANRPYIAMELLDGRTLRERIDEGALPLRKALGYGLEIVEGLAAAHDKGISHRDLKPANIFITREDRVKILDFGLAAVRQPLLPDSPAAETMLVRDSPTTPGMVLGTIGYMSPEQVRGEQVDHRADIFAFGSVLFEMLSGSRAFHESTAVETMHAILVREPGFDRLATAPEPVMQVLRRCLEKRAEQRFQSARDLAFALQTLLAQPGLGSFGSGSQWRESHSGITSSSPAALTSYRAIAVLPFSNLSNDPDMEYFSDGVTEEIINALAQLPQLRVAARTSSFAFKGKAVNLGEVGTRLKVDSVLEGSVRRAGKRLRVTAQLINVADGYQLWAERYDRDLDDVFAIQDDIATNIARRLQLTLSGDSEPLVRPSTGYMDAYDLYLQGRFCVEQRGAGLGKGLSLYQQALARDPKFALVHAAIAEVMTLLAVYVIGDPAERMQHAQRAARTALELDAGLADAHGAMAVVKMLWEWDWPGALAEFERTLEINPNHVSARYWKGIFYHQWCRGDHETALQETRRAVELDPMGTVPLYGECLVLIGMGRFDDAARRASSGLERDANSPLLHRVVGVSLLGQQRYAEAVPHIERATTLAGRQPVMLSELAATYHVAGRIEEADAAQQELAAHAKSTYVSPVSLAMLASMRGQIEEGVAHLKTAFERRDPQLLAVLVWPSTAALRQDARVRELYQRIGIDWVK